MMIQCCPETKVERRGYLCIHKFDLMSSRAKTDIVFLGPGL